MKSKLFLLLVSVTLFFSCQKDLGEYIHVKINVPSFTEIRHDAHVDVVLFQGTAFNVEFDGYELVFADLDFKVFGNKLVISQYGHYWSSGKSTIYITLPDLALLETTSGGDVYSDSRLRPKGDLELRIKSSGDIDLDVDVTDLYTTVDGSGDVRLRGYADDHDLDVYGSGNVYAFLLNTYNTKLDQNSYGMAELSASRNLRIRLRGAGDVYYLGRPYLDYFISGTGRLIDAN